ncbi:hypothetical protein AJ78_01476 [Emergomyces pasteurianus Ep9510]|uniref:Ubiquitin 3 binding protein But2 C-terminal domain-containing protein n=1 Tax=Emergomyces pasteurianus Ep9510 TaxID=1447872 RepID=A0A1J9QQM4_9EURO|nr:hypothetical protein AJ78_01476 [Emergomyces pasteurianus Ep9510]
MPLEPLRQARAKFLVLRCTPKGIEPIAVLIGHRLSEFEPRHQRLKITFSKQLSSQYYLSSNPHDNNPTTAKTTTTNMHFLQATTFLLAALSVQSVSAIPARNRDSLPSQCQNVRGICKPGESGVLRGPDMRTILNGKRSTKTRHSIKLSKTGNDKREQEMTFHAPKGAKKCNINWVQGAERKFTVKDSGLVQVYPVNSGSEAIGTADFTNWPQVQGEHSHIVTSVDCAEEMTFRIALQSDGSVNMKQDATNGWYMEYSC